MATPYFQKRHNGVGSTQDVARDLLGDLPVLVLAPFQTAGRGRSGSTWLNSDRALAASLAFRSRPEDDRPFSLMAGVAAARVVDGARLKWPNDVYLGDLKAGGILVEVADDVVVVGLGLNLWWPDAPQEMTAIYKDDPGENRHLEVGALWGAEMMSLLDAEGWPADEYRRGCLTVGKAVTWEPGGSGHAIGVAENGGLIVDTSRGRETIFSGDVSLVRGS